MSDRIIEQNDIIEKIVKALCKAEGDDIADLYNRLVDGPEITYEGNSVYIYELSKESKNLRSPSPRRN